MKISLVTTFFGSHSFGGDAAYVDRLSRALLRRGHEVHVVYCVDAFEAVRGEHPPRAYEAPAGLHVHGLRSGVGILSPVATQATGLPWFKSGALREILRGSEVVHFHNISLVGGPGVLGFAPGSIRIMTAHEHWITCEMHLLWKMDRESCESRECVRCAISGGRPPQVWRRLGMMGRAIGGLDALLFPSRHALEAHRARGVSGPPMLHLPYFLPGDWGMGGVRSGRGEWGRPYIAAAGRLVGMKGFQRLIPAMRGLPEVDLRIGGTGPMEGELKRMAEGLGNVHFEGLLSGEELAGLFGGARAVVVPSLFPETFGYVVLESFAVGTPVIVHGGGGAIYETGVESGGGLGYETEGELQAAVRRLVGDEGFRRRLAERGMARRLGEWSEESHMEMYFKMIGMIEGARGRGERWRPEYDSLLELRGVGATEAA